MWYRCQHWAEQAQSMWLAAEPLDFFTLFVMITLIGWQLSNMTKEA